MGLEAIALAGPAHTQVPGRAQVQVQYTIFRWGAQGKKRLSGPEGRGGDVPGKNQIGDRSGEARKTQDGQKRKIWYNIY